MDRRQFLKGLAAVGVAAMVPLRWINDHIPGGPWFVAEIRYYDHRLSDKELEKLSNGISIEARPRWQWWRRAGNASELD